MNDITFRIQSVGSAMCGFYCIEHLIVGKTLLDCANLCFLNDY